jgi:predicted membrane protein
MPLLDVVVALVLVAVAAGLINTYVRIPGDLMRILNLVLALLVVGMILWLINTYVPMAGSIKAVLNIVVVVATCVRVLQVVGLWDGVVRIWDRLTKNIPTTRA